jgi:hypothetical protein
MLRLAPEQAGAKTAYESAALARQIGAVDAQIEQLVYSLYGVSSEQRRIVESAPPPAITAVTQDDDGDQQERE